MLAFSYFYFKNIRNSINASTRLYLTEMSKQSAQTIQDRIDKDFGVLKSVSSVIEESNKLNLVNIVNILNSEVKRNSFKRMGIIFRDGKAITNDWHKVELGDRKYFKEALKGKATISDTIIDRVDGKKINVYAIPVYKNSKVIAVLFAATDNSVFRDILTIPTFGGAGFSYVAKSNGDIVVSPNQENKIDFNNIFKQPHFLDNSDFEKVKSDFESKKGNILLLEDSDAEYYLNYSPIKYNDWYFISITPRDIVTKNFDKILQMVVYTSFFIILLFVLLFILISRLQNNYSKTLESIVFVDDVTGGNSWIYFKKKASALIANTNKKYAFLVFDVDKFKLINDIFGWEHGNQTLKFIAKKLKKSLREDELFARVANDNFAVLLRYDKDDDIVKRLIRFRKKLANYSMNPQTPYKLTFSCGVYRIPDYATDFDIMHNKASFAKNLIKESISSSYAFYDDEMRNKIVWHNELEREMNKALTKKQFSVYLQPKYSLSNSKIVGAEALVRWVHPEKGLIPPNEFIPLFEKNGFIAKLDLYIFETVCQKIKEWIESGRPLVTVSVNISRVNFHNEQLAEILYKIASKYKIPVGFIEIEITESAVFENIDNLIGIIQNLRMYGFPVSIDDFGSGYSSLNLLKDLEVDVLKLDREFFNFSKDFERSQKVVTSVITMAKGLHIKTVSEGVETFDHVTFLKKIGCDIAQGYYFARPMPLSDFETLLLEETEKAFVP